MITLLVGPYTARKVSREKLLSRGLRETLTDADISVSALLERAADSLFGEVRAYSISGGLSGEHEEEIISILPDLASSKHLFVFEEDKALKAITDTFKNAGGAVEVIKEAEAGKFVNRFALADALLARDKKKLWLLLRENLEGGASPEELAGILAWQMRMLLAAKNTKTPDEAGVKEFPYMKAKRAAQTFGVGEVERLSRELVRLYHESRRGAGSLDLLLEKFVLTAL